ncbi:MAG: ribosome recycling factor [Methylococcales bacterium]|nr:ribosome recycling factor [Methylococcales bacterium]
MIDDIQQDASARMTKSCEALDKTFTRIRTGRAHPSLLEQIKVSYYGSETPLSQVANIGIEDSRTLKVTPWEKPMVKAIEKAIMSANLGLNPATTGTVIRIPLPPLTEERRRDLVKVARSEAEGARVAVRNIRRDANSDFKSLEKEKEISEDEEHQAQDNIQNLTDKFVKEIDAIVSVKEEDLMKV